MINKEDKNIGIMTWHRMENYGSVLQLYSLNTYLKNRGFNTYVIDYVYYMNYNKITFFLSRFRLLNLVKEFFFDTKRWKSFKKFHKENFDFTKKVSKKEDFNKIVKHIDIFICGSDQIWSSNEFDLRYFLDFVPDNKTRISYAPSTVIDNYTESQKHSMKIELNKFNKISVRELKGKEIIERISNLHVEKVLDPTFLLDKKDWEQISSNFKPYNNYLLFYCLGGNKKHREIASKIAKKRNLKIVTLVFNSIDTNFGDLLYDDKGPKDFLSLIQNAEIVCTDSFHGICLSIIFEKDFFAFERFERTDIINQNDRISEILNIFRLENRLISEYTMVDLSTKINYVEVKNILKKEINKSQDFLKGALYENSN